MIRFPAEWEPQDGVLLAWPHAATDWAPVLDRVEPVYLRLAREIARFEKLLVIHPEPASLRPLLGDHGVDLSNTRWCAVPTNDTWTRDYGPLTVHADGRPRLLDFGFNGWGLKFPSDQDNQVTRRLAAAGLFGKVPLDQPGLVLEGGSLESDGRGTLLTTAECLLGPNRNPHLDRASLERELGRWLGAERTLWLEHGALEGDDTDAHIDTLARFAPEETILFTACDDPRDNHHGELAAMAAELERLRTAAGRPFRLLPLPWPAARFDAEGCRLPATYANFLVVNGAVLAPVYGDPADDRAMEVIAEAFPGREVVAVDCSALIEQHGSLHCVTMQLPKGVLP